MRLSEFIKKPQTLLLVVVICALIVVSFSKSKEKCNRDEDDDKSGKASTENLLNYLSSKRPYDFDDKKEKHGTFLPFQGAIKLILSHVHYSQQMFILQL